MQVFGLHFQICEEGKCSGLDPKLLFLPFLLAQRARGALPRPAWACTVLLDFVLVPAIWDVNLAAAEGDFNLRHHHLAHLTSLHDEEIQHSQHNSRKIPFK